MARVLNISKGQTVSVAKTYWKNIEPRVVHSCPNVSLFRFLGTAGIGLDRLSVLEIGFGANDGQDLLEARKRGANAYGTDINEMYVKEFGEKYPDIKVRCTDAGKEELPFEGLDLVFSRDVIYYLTNEEIRFNFKDCFEKLNPGGNLVFQYIEKDIELIDPTEPGQPLDLQGIASAVINSIAPKENPIRFLDPAFLHDAAITTGFSFVAKKALIESYGNDEQKFRVNRYFMFRK